jgi:UDP-N-acetylglucosamine 1-carboxyvinyltransferase
MSEFHIFGGAPLDGVARVGGAKNAALPIMAAALLAEGPVRLRGVPRVSDVATMAQLLRRLGMRVARHGDDLLLQTVDPRPVAAPEALVRRMRASFCVLGPLLARSGRAVVPLPGGCRIGDRPVDLHLAGLRALGAEFRVEAGRVVATARRLRGAVVHLCGLLGPTVTGTANVLSAAAMAEGRTEIIGAAREPEIVDLGRFLIALGARIGGLGTSRIEVEGVTRLTSADHRILPDRIEAATLLLAAAITGGCVTLHGAAPENLAAVLESLRAAGCRIECMASAITLTAPGRPLPMEVVAASYPGLPTDVQAPLTALLSLAAGRSWVSDGVFPARFAHLAELRRLGASIRLAGPVAEIEGVAALAGATVSTGDLRAGAALVLAGLAARGETIIRGAAHLDRGYEALDHKLRLLGAQIERHPGETSRAAGYLPPATCHRSLAR